MISKLHLKNFRGFEDHVVPLRPMTIIVGRNNAGKSTIVEALRLISVVVTRFKGEIASIPRYWQFPKGKKGSSPYKNLEINLKSVFFHYGDPPAEIGAEFSTGEVVWVTISNDEIVAQYTRPKGARQSTLPSRVSILPQVGPVAREEELLTSDYVRGAISSALAPLHFRNQLYLLSEYFDDFKSSTEATWPGLRIVALEKNGQVPNPVILSLIVEDNHFAAELAWMGHGLQMWLQTLWFLTRAKDHETVILDEPDVYMHADLQRRLVRHLRNTHKQVIIATHSSEIMAEVNPENILIIDRDRNHSNFASNLPAVQKVLTGFGSIHNLQLSRLWNTRRFLMVEGEDIALLKPLQNTLFPESQTPIDTIPFRSIGGWGGWTYAVGSEMFLENAGGEGIVTYCIFDSDYYPIQELTTRYTEAKQRNISLHIWKRKEIENYLLVPNTIQRIIKGSISDINNAPSIDDVEKQIEKIAKSLRTETEDNIATQLQQTNRKLTIATANQEARKIVSERWQTQAGRFGIIPGKKALSKLSLWSQNKFSVSFGPITVANQLLASEIDDELKMVITIIENCGTFT